MMRLQTAVALKPSLRNAERRRHYRVPVEVLGRYMLPNRQEYPCQTVDMSPGGVLFVAPVKGAVGDRVIAYLEHIGRIEGEIARHVPDGFAMTIAATIRKRDKLAAQLTWLANRDTLGLEEDRGHERIVPRQLTTIMRLSNGRELAVRLIDLSRSGAAISMENPLEIGTSVVLGRTAGTVIRHFQGGIAVEFAMPISPDRFDENIKL
jgi:c-di-GMP-binding flagellar brake protein YcgR